MNDILVALQKEHRILKDMYYMIELYLKKQSPVISKTPYTEQDLKDCERRATEVNIAIEAIKSFRKAHPKTT